MARRYDFFACNAICINRYFKIKERTHYMGLKMNLSNFFYMITFTVADVLLLGGQDHCIPSRTQPDPDVRGPGEPGIQCETDKDPPSPFQCPAADRSSYSLTPFVSAFRGGLAAHTLVVFTFHKIMVTATASKNLYSSLLLTNLSFLDDWAYTYTLNPNNGESAPGRVLFVIPSSSSSSSSYHGSLVATHFLLRVTSENGNKEDATIEG
jgi:hypothetical protein